MIAASIVSHGHGSMVADLINQLLECQEVNRIIVTINIDEDVKNFPKNPKVQYVFNKIPKGYGANHNAAYELVNDLYFCVLNPDLYLVANPYPDLLKCFGKANVKLVAPLVISKSGKVEDSMRYFPTLSSLIMKFMCGNKGSYGISFQDKIIFPNWIAGMFMLFESNAYETIGGFDESFFMYYEDVDICKRLWMSGGIIVGEPSCKVVHDARRASRRNFQHMRWHFMSMLRYLWRYR